MSQHDYVIDNAPGQSVRVDMQTAIQALASISSGAVEPVTKYPGMLWLDLSVTPDGVLRQRNQGNTNWVPVLLSSEFRFQAADLYYGYKLTPNRFVWNDKFDGSGTDIMTLSETGVLSLPVGTPSAPTDVVRKGYVDAVVVPVGTVVYVAMQTPPANYLKCNGASLPRSTYAALFTAIGTAFGSTDGASFNVPELRGEFIRAWDDGRGADAGRAFGTWQDDAFASHTHTATAGGATANHTHTWSDSATATTSAGGAHTHTTPIFANGQLVVTNGLPTTGYRQDQGTQNAASSSAGSHSHSVTVNVGGTTGIQSATHSHNITLSAAGGGADTRPRNVALMPVIKYQ